MTPASNGRGLTMSDTSTADPGPTERAGAERAGTIKSVRRVGVVGLGVMGLGIAQAVAAAGLRVVAVGRDAESAISGQRRLAAEIGRQVSGNRLCWAAAAALLENVEPSKDDASLDACDLAIESVDEDRGIKAQVLRRIEAALPRTAPIATNTSGLTISGLAVVLRRPERLIGLHFFSPLERLLLAAVVPRVLTDRSTERGALAFVANIGKRALIARDSAGFFTSRGFAAYLDEALATAGDGVSPALVEQAAQASGRATAPPAVLGAGS